jgi:DUF1365 family protein
MWRSAGAILLPSTLNQRREIGAQRDKKFYVAFFERELLAHYVIWISRMR